MGFNQATRWVNTKEEHCKNIITSMGEYCLCQRVKPVGAPGSPFTSEEDFHGRACGSPRSDAGCNEGEAIQRPCCCQQSGGCHRSHGEDVPEVDGFTRPGGSCVPTICRAADLLQARLPSVQRMYDMRKRCLPMWIERWSVILATLCLTLSCGILPRSESISSKRPTSATEAQRASSSGEDGRLDLIFSDR